VRRSPASAGLIAALVAAFALGACGGDDGGAQDPIEPAKNFDGTVKIGLLTSVSGPGSTYYPGIEQASKLAVEEINADGGVLGNKVELVIADTETQPSVAAREARRLVREGAKFIVQADVASDRDAALEVISTSDIPYTFAWDNEGGPNVGGTANICHPNVWQTGQVPNNWIPDAIKWLMDNRGLDKWAVLGNDYRWPHTMRSLATEVIEDNGGEVVFTKFVPFGTTEFGAPITQLQGLDDDVAVLNLLVGADLIGFFKQWNAAGGANDKMITFSLDEQTMEAIGPAADGVMGAFAYFATLDTPENEKFLQKLEDRFGDDAGTPSSLSEQPYEAIGLWALAAERAGSYGVKPISDAYPKVEFTGPRGRVSYLENHHMELPLRIGVAGTDGRYDEFIAEFPPKNPEDQCDPSAYTLK
jgi:urea transport system substrate-binding protein